MSNKIKNLVVDTTAFIKNTQLQDIAENVYTCEEVLNEVKNNNQIKRLAVLPYNLKVKQPESESLQHVIDFAKKTGDYATLSLTDLTVLALTYQLEKDLLGVDHLRTEPVVSKTVFSANKPVDLQDSHNIVGFYNPQNKKESSIADEDELDEDVMNEVIGGIEDNAMSSSDEASGDEHEQTEAGRKIIEENDKLIEKFGTLGFNTVANDLVDDILQPVKEEAPENSSENDSNNSQEEEEDDNDDSGWITPSNIVKVKKNYGSDMLDEKPVEVACITTDFAMQNVLKQIGLNVTALDGRIIRHMRTFILRCYTCFKTTGETSRIFCGKCGHKTLKRVAVSVNENGEQVVHINSRRTLSAKFKNRPIPAPQGGKHACNPILFEDQPLPQQRITKKAQLTNAPLDDEYLSGYSPFLTRDVDSRSALLRTTNNIKQWMKNYEYDNHRRGYKKYKK